MRARCVVAKGLKEVTCVKCGDTLFFREGASWRDLKNAVCVCVVARVKSLTRVQCKAAGAVYFVQALFLDLCRYNFINL